VSAPILFVGGGAVGDATLRHLVDTGHPPAAVVGMADHAHEAVRYEPRMRALCESNGIAWAGADLPAAALGTLIRERGIDFLLTTGYRRLIPASVYGLCRRGAVGSHFSMLPAYRGFAPVNWAVLNGEARTGVSLFHLEEAMDSGDLVGQAEVEIGPDETAGEVLERAVPRYLELLGRHLPALLAGTAPRMPQDHAAATYTCARVPGDGVIDWTMPARRIHDLVRALAHPFPGASTTHRGRRLSIWRTRIPESPRRYVGLVPGRVVGTQGDAAEVLAGDGVLQVLAVQYDGEDVSPAARILRSVRDTLGR
jgi:methionyl-tRNA formyltransferase